MITKIKNTLKSVANLKEIPWLILLISCLSPLIIMALFGIFLAFKYGYLIPLSLATALFTLCVPLPLFFLSKRNHLAKSMPLSDDEVATLSPYLVQPNQEWSDTEKNILSECQHAISQTLSQSVAWAEIDKQVFHLLEFVAQKFNKKALDFTIPEALTLFEEIGKRYKSVMHDHVPAVDYIKISHLKSGVDLYAQYGEIAEKIFQTAMTANLLKNLYLNPIKAAIDFTQQQTSASLHQELLANMDYKAKQALLEEVAAVAIDLYSGRFCIDNSDLCLTEIEEIDRQRQPDALSPMRVVLIGQTGSGKSSIINVLSEEFSAEIDLLPSTVNTQSFQIEIDGKIIRLIDTKGLDGDDKTDSALFNEILHADLILWVLKANQSSRALDQKFHQSFVEYFLQPEQLSRKRPRILAVLNQVDKLKPIEAWQPPYSLTTPTSKKAKTIVDALDYNNNLLKFETLLPLAIPPDKANFGVDNLQSALFDSFKEANNVQRNRQKNEAIIRKKSIKNQLSQTAKAGKNMVPKAIKLAAPTKLQRVLRKWFT